MSEAGEPTQTVKRLIWLAAIAIAAAVAAIGPQAASAADPCLRINEIYAVGGTATSTYDRDFVELRNVCGTAQELGTLVVAPIAGNPNGANVGLSNITIPANGNYVVGFGTPAGPGASFTPNLSYGSDLESANAIAGLTNTGVQFNPCVPVDGGIWFDLVGYGASPPCSETAPAAAPSETQSISRDSSSTDTDANNADFTLQAPSPSTGPTAVRVRSFSVVATTRGVIVRWRTTSSANVLGFNVWRSAGGAYRKANSVLIPAKVGQQSFVDRTARRGAKLRYKLQVIAPDGRATWFGPATVGG